MQANKENLTKLADFVEENISQENFDMFVYRRDRTNGVPTAFFGFNDCGTVGCLLGWAPFVKGLEPKDSHFEFSSHHNKDFLDFETYSEDFFGLETYSDEWVCLFSGDWKMVDNTVTGAVKRIRDFVNHGLLVYPNQ